MQTGPPPSNVVSFRRKLGMCEAHEWIKVQYGFLNGNHPRCRRGNLFRTDVSCQEKNGVFLLSVNILIYLITFIFDSLPHGVLVPFCIEEYGRNIKITAEFLL